MKEIEIDGLAVKIDEGKASDWHMLGILRRMRGASEYDQLDILFEAIEYMTDQSEESIVGHLGGDTAQVQDVISLASNIIGAASGKN